MHKIDNDEFGQFLYKLRKEKGMTQKQLAEKLYLSDKAVSKWERGLSLPDISLIMPLSKILEVTTTELLSGRRIEANTSLTVQEVEALMTKTITLSKEDKEELNYAKGRRQLLFWLTVICFALELILLSGMHYTSDTLFNNMGVVSILMLMCGTYFTFYAKETLPIYYDSNKVTVYHDGIFTMNVLGLTYNNSNWRHILKAAHLSVLSIMVLFPLLYLSISQISPTLWDKGKLIFMLGSTFSMFVPIYVVGKKYE